MKDSRSPARIHLLGMRKGEISALSSAGGRIVSHKERIMRCEWCKESLKNPVVWETNQRVFCSDDHWRQWENVQSRHALVERFLTIRGLDTRDVLRAAYMAKYNADIPLNGLCDDLQGFVNRESVPEYLYEFVKPEEKKQARFPGW